LLYSIYLFFFIHLKTDTENNCNTLAIYNTLDDNSNGTDTEPKNTSKSSSKIKLNKKSAKTKKSAKGKGKVKRQLKAPSVFERLADAAKNKGILL